MAEREFSLGTLYSGIRGESRKEEESEDPTKIVDPKYVKICKRIYKSAPSLGTPKKYPEKMQEIIDFLGWRLEAKHYYAGVKGLAMGSLLVTIILTIFSYLTFFLLDSYVESVSALNISPMIILILSISLFIIIFGSLTYYFSIYPSIVAKREQRLSLVYMPQILGYLTMSLKLVPNMERGIKFAALQGKGKLADDFKKLLWDVNIGVYSTVSQGVDILAYKWKKFSSEFKEAIMMIKSGMVEDNDAKRSEMLDKTLENVLESIKIKMEGYARALTQPSLVLFYVGVLLPLLLVIILPIGSVFAGLPFANPWVLFIIYDVVLPLFVFLYARHVLNSVPSLYSPPQIPDNFRGVPKKGNMKIGKFQFNLKFFVGLVFVLGILASSFLQISYGVTLEKVFESEYMDDKYIQNPNLYFRDMAEDSLNYSGKRVTEDRIEQKAKELRLLYLMEPGHDITPYYLIYGFALTLALCIFLFFFFSAYYKKKVQDYYVEQEEEFKEILYILSSRMGEGKPFEDALKQTKSFFSDLNISKDILAKISDNINLLGLPIEQALYDPMFGALKDNPSNLIKNNFRLIVDSVKLGVVTGAKTTMSIAMQLKNVDEIKNLIRKVTADIVQMMSTMSAFIAPAVLGITTSMQKIIITTLNSLATSNIGSSTANVDSSSLGELSSFNVNELMGSFDTTSIGAMATPTTFNIIIIIYVVLLVMILAYFTSRLDSDNPLATKLAIAYTTPIAVIVFIIAAFGAGLLLGGV